jgi:hypothetical protein
MRIICVVDEVWWTSQHIQYTVSYSNCVKRGGHEGRNERPLHSAGPVRDSSTNRAGFFYSTMNRILCDELSWAEMSALHVTCLTGERTCDDRPITRDISCDFDSMLLSVHSERNILTFRHLDRDHWPSLCTASIVT